MTGRLGASCLLLIVAGRAETLRFRAEWRGVNAGMATLEPGSKGAKLGLVTAGFARVLYPVNDVYTVDFDDRGCAASSLMKIEEGRTRAETGITYGGSVHVLLKDLRTAKEQTRDFVGANCTNDILAALAKLRAQRVEPGKSVEFAIANERKLANVRVEALGRESIGTATGKQAAIRHEVHMMNGILYRRNGRLFVWLSDDPARTPLRIRVQMPFYLGTVTLELENRQ